MPHAARPRLVFISISLRWSSGRSISPMVYPSTTSSMWPVGLPSAAPSTAPEGLPSSAPGNEDVALTSELDDLCDPAKPCAPSKSGDPLYCDYAIGPEAGGRCQMCGLGEYEFFRGKEEAFCREVGEIGTTERIDCEDKCMRSRDDCFPPCAEGKFCDHHARPDASCRPCADIAIHRDICKMYSVWPAAGIAACETCPPKSCTNSMDCITTKQAGLKFFCNFDASGSVDGEEPKGICEPCAGLTSIDECAGRSKTELALQECADVCEEVILTSCAPPMEKVQGSVFSHEVPAGAGSEGCKENRFGPHFCNNDFTCQLCPSVYKGRKRWHVNDCFGPDMGLSNAAAQSCANACQTNCWTKENGLITIEGLGVEYGNKQNRPFDHWNGFFYSVSGPLVDCQSGGAGECPPDVTPGFMCLTHYSVHRAVNQLIHCQDAGGIGVIQYNKGGAGYQGILNDNYYVIIGHVPLEISGTAITEEDGLFLKEHALGLETTLTIAHGGDNCKTGCSERIPCPNAASLEHYCNYEAGYGSHGFCTKCPQTKDERGEKCFLSGLSLRGAQECAIACSSTVFSPSCKLCGEDVSAKFLQSASGEEDICNFCPDGLEKSYFDRWIPFIWEDSTCEEYHPTGPRPIWHQGERQRLL